MSGSLNWLRFGYVGQSAATASFDVVLIAEKQLSVLDCFRRRDLEANRVFIRARDSAPTVNTTGTSLSGTIAVQVRSLGLGARSETALRECAVRERPWCSWMQRCFSARTSLAFIRGSCTYH